MSVVRNRPSKLRKRRKYKLIYIPEICELLKVTASESFGIMWKYWWTMNMLNNPAVLSNSSSSSDTCCIVRRLAARGGKPKAQIFLSCYAFLWYFFKYYSTGICFIHWIQLFILMERYQIKNKTFKNAIQLYTICYSTPRAQNGCWFLFLSKYYSRLGRVFLLIPCCFRWY